MNKYLSLLAGVWLAGCTVPPTVETVRAQPAGQMAFQVDQSLDTAFDVVLRQTRECYLNRPTEWQWIVSDRWDVTRRVANVTVSLVYGAVGVEPYLVVDLQEPGARRTDVAVFHTSPKTAAEAQLVRQWVTQGARHCAGDPPS